MISSIENGKPADTHAGRQIEARDQILDQVSHAVGF